MSDNLTRSNSAVNLKPIETTYGGVLFRSRLEAKWAVFFDGLKIKWLYEPEGFELEAGRYLPDFYLPELKIWVEIKASDTWRTDARLQEFAAKLGTNWYSDWTKNPGEYFCLCWPQPNYYESCGAFKLACYFLETIYPRNRQEGIKQIQKAEKIANSYRFW